MTHNLLFVCSRNQCRSPTGEAIWHRRQGFSARSAGTSPRAKRKINSADIEWADIIFVMETKHRQQLKTRFNQLLTGKPLYILDIPDEYHYMDTELVELLNVSVTAIVGET